MNERGKSNRPIVPRKQSNKGVDKTETFDLLEFTHICGKTRKGRFIVLRMTVRKRIRIKLQELRKELRRRFHKPIPEVGKWLGSVLRGYYRYFGVAGNSRKLESFRHHLIRLWYRTLGRRSQRSKLNWERMNRLVEHWIPRSRIYHPYPDFSLYVNIRGRNPVR